MPSVAASRHALAVAGQLALTVPLALASTLALAAAGCGGGSPGQPSGPDAPAGKADAVEAVAGEPIAVGRPAPAPSPVIEPGPSSARDVDAALARCAAAVESAGALAPLEGFTAVATGCADVYSRAECRDAFREAPSLPVERRATSIAIACAGAYCPSLPTPQPALCGMLDEPPPPTAMPRLWADLHTRILFVDLGAERAEALLARMAAIGRARSQPPRDAAPECHASCCPPVLRRPAPDGTIECCLCE